MKRAKLLQTLGEIAGAKGMSLELVRHGANHDIFRLGGWQFPIGRHPDVPERTARGTIRKAQGL